MNGIDPLGYNDVVEAVTIDELEARLAEHFVEECCTMSVVEPLEEKEND